MKKNMVMGVFVCISILIIDFSNSIAGTYTKFGISFDYPKDQDILVKGVPLYGKEASKNAGSIWIKSDPKTNPVILISWLPSKRRDYKYIAKMMGVGIKARKANHDIHLEKRMREMKVEGHLVIVQRFCTQGREGILLNVIAGWYCDQSNRIFQITCSAPWKDPTFIVKSLNNPEPSWPPVKNDTSFVAFKNLINSFTCH